MKSKNGFDLFDMSGNVFEWCYDRYAEPFTGGINPTGPASGSFRVYRGGGWYLGAEYCAVSYRDLSLPTYHNMDLGLRLARSCQE
jgi:formylglycine-generating enzyme required for sulfatase activity